jgi:hypothetical protein
VFENKVHYKKISEHVGFKVVVVVVRIRLLFARMRRNFKKKLLPLLS